jgi:hypothetical protein
VVVFSPAANLSALALGLTPPGLAVFSEELVFWGTFAVLTPVSPTVTSVGLGASATTPPHVSFTHPTTTARSCATSPRDFLRTTPSNPAIAGSVDIAGTCSPPSVDSMEPHEGDVASRVPGLRIPVRMCTGVEIPLECNLDLDVECPDSDPVVEEEGAKDEVSHSVRPWTSRVCNSVNTLSSSLSKCCTCALILFSSVSWAGEGDDVELGKMYCFFKRQTSSSRLMSFVSASARPPCSTSCSTSDQTRDVNSSRGSSAVGIVRTFEVVIFETRPLTERAEEEEEGKGDVPSRRSGVAAECDRVEGV